MLNIDTRNDGYIVITGPDSKLDVLTPQLENADMSVDYAQGIVVAYYGTASPDTALKLAMAVAQE